MIPDLFGCAEEVAALMAALFPLHRGIAGAANRETLRLLQTVAPMAVREYPSGKRIYDWVIPPEWDLRHAHIADAAGRILVDAADSPLHVVTGSAPVDAVMTGKALLPRLHSLPGQPDAIPYRTDYYQGGWGFCVSHRQLLRDFHPEETYHVLIDASTTFGAMSAGELFLEGESSRTLLISTYICHPAMANDNLSGMVVAALVARALAAMPRKRSYQFVWAPETIGALAWCHDNADALRSIDGGVVVTTCGGTGSYGYKQAFKEDHYLNHLVEAVFYDAGISFLTYPFAPVGSDERQFSSPGFRIPTVSITKDKYYEYPAYHTSLDDLSCVSARQLMETASLYLALIRRIDDLVFYRRTNPYGEPMLSRHGLYATLGGGYLAGSTRADDALLRNWILFLSDGSVPLEQIARRSGAPLERVFALAAELADAGLLERA